MEQSPGDARHQSTPVLRTAAWLGVGYLFFFLGIFKFDVLGIVGGHSVIKLPMNECEASQVKASYGLTHWVTHLGSILFGVAFCLNTASMITSQPLKRRLNLNLCFVNLVSFLTYLALHLRVPNFCFHNVSTGIGVGVLRYLQWCFTTPMLLFLKVTLTGAPVGVFGPLIFADWTMLLGGMFADASPVWGPLWYFYSAVSFLSYFYILTILWRMFSNARANECLVASRMFYQIVATTTVIVWSVAPVSWSLFTFNIVGVEGAEVGFLLTDMFAKLILCALVVQTNIARLDASLILAKEEAEHQAEKNKRLMGTIAREMTSPLYGIQGLQKQLVLSPLDERQSKIVETMKHCANLLDSAVGDVLRDASTGEIRMEESSFHLGDCINAVVEVVAPHAFKKNVEVVTHVAASCERYVNGDAPRLQRVLLNLLSNALQLTDTGFIAVRANAEQKGETITLRCSVEDSGIGVDSESMQKMLNAARGTDDRIGTDTWGLSLSQELVQRMGGSLGVDSAEGKGSRFFFTVSLRSFGESFTGKHNVMQYYRCLVVHPDAGVCSLLGDFFDRTTSRYFSATNVLAAWDLLEQNFADRFEGVSLLVVDESVAPDKGRELLERLRRHVRLAYIQTVLMAVSDDKPHTGAIDYVLVKPISAAAFLRIPPPTFIASSSASRSTSTHTPGSSERHSVGVAASEVTPDDKRKEALETMLTEGSFETTSSGSHRLRYKHPHRSEQVVVVEPNPDDRGAYMSLLQGCGFPNVVALPSMWQLLALVERGLAQGDPPLLILMRFRPSDAGELRRLRELETAFGFTDSAAVIAVTATGDDATLERCRAAGVDTVLLAPFAKTDLLDAITTTLGSAGDEEHLQNDGGDADGADGESAASSHSVLKLRAREIGMPHSAPTETSSNPQEPSAPPRRCLSESDKPASVLIVYHTSDVGDRLEQLVAAAGSIPEKCRLHSGSPASRMEAYDYVLLDGAFPGAAKDDAVRSFLARVAAAPATALVLVGADADLSAHAPRAPVLSAPLTLASVKLALRSRVP